MVYGTATGALVRLEFGLGAAKAKENASVLFAPKRGNVRFLAVNDNGVFRVEGVLRPSFGLRENSSNVRRHLRFLTLIGIFRQGWVLVFRGYLAVDVSRAGERATRLHALTAVNAPTGANLAGVALAAVASARDTVCGSFGHHIETNFICFACLPREGFANGCCLVRSHVNGGLGFVHHPIVRLYANVRQSEQRIWLHSHRVLCSRHVRSCPVRFTCRLFYLFRLFFFRGYISDSVSAYVM